MGSSDSVKYSLLHWSRRSVVHVEWRAPRQQSAYTPSRRLKKRGSDQWHKMPSGEGVIPVDLLAKRDEVADLVDSSLTGKRVERPPPLRGNPRVELQPRSWGVSVGLSAPLIDGHRIAGR